MRVSRTKTSHDFEIGFNAAPLIDIVFQLLIFFALVTRFASAENVPLELPKPEESQAREVALTDRVVLNCRLEDVLRPDGPVLYTAGANPPEPLSKISQRLAAAKQYIPELEVVIRADKRIPFAAVRAAIEVVAANGIDRMNLVAQVADED